MNLHHCTPTLSHEGLPLNLPHQGYEHAVTACVEDKTSRLWLVDKSGRKQSQVYFCPFCGFQAFNQEPHKEPMQVTPMDVALTPADRPQRVWKHYQTRYVMVHSQFGTVRVLASDGCHAKVIQETTRQAFTVCVENLSELKGEPMLPRIGPKEEKEVKPKKDRHAVDPEKLSKYLNMGL